MEPEVYKVLEYSRIRSMLADCASSILGKELARSITPTDEAEDVQSSGLEPDMEKKEGEDDGDNTADNSE